VLLQTVEPQRCVHLQGRSFIHGIRLSCDTPPWDGSAKARSWPVFVRVRKGSQGPRALTLAKTSRSSRGDLAPKGWIQVPKRG